MASRMMEDVKNPKKAKRDFWKWIHEDVLQLNFYRVHMSYFILGILVSSVIVYGEGLSNAKQEINGGKLRYVDALFLCCSAMTTTGLNTVNLGDLTAFQQSMLCVLMIIGNVVFVSTAIVVIRRYWFVKKMKHLVKHTKAGKEIAKDIERQASRESNKNGGKKEDEESPRGTYSSSGVRQRKPNSSEKKQPQVAEKEQKERRQHHQAGFGAFPAPWETNTLRSAARLPFRSFRNQDYHAQEYWYLSFEPKFDARGRFEDLDEHEVAELGGVEFRALDVLLWILPLYQLFWYALGVVFLTPYAYREDVKIIITTSQPGNLNPGWWAFFNNVTSFTNSGLNVLNSNFIPWAGYYYILIFAGALTLAGNTQFPIFLRLIIWTGTKVTPQNSRLRQSFLFLLHHPRRCFIYLFPAKETWYLFAIQVVVDLLSWALYEILNHGLPFFIANSAGINAMDGLFQAIGLRNSGAYIETVSDFAPALLVFFIVAMYISSFPIVMALRQTNSYEERSIGVDKGDGGGGLATHLRMQLAYDIWFQILAWFLVCVIERGQLVVGAQGFTVFAILFEVTSAYGTVGLSTGVPYDDYSLSGAFHSLSKLVVMAVMIRGRHRGLPLAVDRSILLPGEGLMHEMEKDYNETGKNGGEKEEEDEKEVRKDEEESGQSGKGHGKEGNEQDPEQNKKGKGDEGKKKKKKKKKKQKKPESDTGEKGAEDDDEKSGSQDKEKKDGNDKQNEKGKDQDEDDNDNDDNDNDDDDDDDDEDEETKDHLQLS